MAGVILRTADLALLSDPVATRVLIPHLVAVQPQQGWDGTVVRFAGDAYPTPFRGEGRDQSWQLQARYGGTEHEELADLLALLDRAAQAADSRLALRTHYGQVPGLDDVYAVVIFGVQVVPQPGQLAEVSMTAQRVAWTPGV